MPILELKLLLGVCTETYQGIDLLQLVGEMSNFSKLVSIVTRANYDWRHILLMSILKMVLLDLDCASYDDIVAV